MEQVHQNKTTSTDCNFGQKELQFLKCRKQVFLHSLEFLWEDVCWLLKIKKLFFPQFSSLTEMGKTFCYQNLSVEPKFILLKITVMYLIK